MKQLGWQTLEDRWEINVLMFKIVNDIVPPYLFERFVKRETEYGYNTRVSHVNHLSPNRIQTSLSIALTTVEEPPGILYQLIFDWQKTLKCLRIR